MAEITHAREFFGGASNDQIDFTVGDLGVDPTAFTVACILKLTGGSGFQTFVQLGNPWFGTEVSGDPVASQLWDNNFLGLHVGLYLDEWMFTLASKSDGSVPWFVTYRYSTGEFSYGAGSDTQTLGTINAARIGGFGTEYLNGIVACAGVWVADSLITRDALSMPHSIAAWEALSPTALWLLDQDDEGTSVQDRVGNSHQSSINNTTAVAVSDLPFNVSDQDDSGVFPTTQNADDGAGYYQHSSWPPSGGSWNDGEFSDRIYVGKELSAGPTYTASVAFVRFDTSAIPDDAEILWAKLILNREDMDFEGTDDFNMVGDYYDFGGEPTVAGDWIETASADLFGPGLIPDDDIENGLNEIHLGDLSGINKFGYTGIRLTLTAGTPTVIPNYIGFSSFADTAQEPRLEVAWALAGGITYYNPPLKGAAFRIQVALEDTDNPGSFQANPTLAAGDVKVSKDGGALANVTTLPAVEPAASVLVTLDLSATEMDADLVTVVFTDQTAPKEWIDRVVRIETYE